MDSTSWQFSGRCLKSRLSGKLQLSRSFSNNVWSPFLTSFAFRDCYVAVTGLPHAQEDHAIIMVKFARDCLRMMRRLTQKLGVTLGPDTADLSIRVGLHSGPGMYQKHSFSKFVP